MFPFLPPHRHYEFEWVGISPPLLCEEAGEGGDQPSEYPCTHINGTKIHVRDGHESGLGWQEGLFLATSQAGPEDADCLYSQEGPVKGLVCAVETPVDDGLSGTTERSDQLRCPMRKRLLSVEVDGKACKRANTEQDSEGTSMPDSTATETTAATSLLGTPDRFSACIPCRRRKIRCIPRGDSHQYNADGTNDGMCATCIRRKKECFWPQSVSTPSTPLVTTARERMQLPVTSKGKATGKELQQDLEVQEEKISMAKNDDTASDSSDSEDSDNDDGDGSGPRATLDHTLFSTSAAGCYFALSTHAFGRCGSTPSLSPSHTSSSSSQPVSPRTDAGFLFPTGIPMDGISVSAHTLLSPCSDHSTQADGLFMNNH